MTVRTVAPSELYSRLAPTYREDFEVPHRKAYDQLAVEAVRTALEAGSTVVDVGCGVGRWVEWLIDDGHDVIGIEPSPGMAAVCRKADFGPRFELQELDVDSAVIGAASVDAVVAMGSIQYAPNPVRSIARMATWLRPGGSLWVLVDSLGALVGELLRRGDDAQAIERVRTGRGRFGDAECEVEHELFDAAGLAGALGAAGLVDVEVRGLLIGWAALPRDRAQAELVADWDRALARERALSLVPGMADLGKQLLATGTAP
ncbi:MAG: class I SAM-dependent methyltransferase [Acidimicrobiales bacterium]|nr:class I SAM-dependent methyltransferase [Acidimicrobiales bacterium]